MSNGDMYERAFKLFAQSLELIVEQKRLLEPLLAILQEFVFGRTAWPRHKVWPRICALKEFDEAIMFTVATLDLSNVQDDPRVQRIVAAFPECFSVNPWQSSIPLSVIRRLGGELATKHGSGATFSDGMQHPQSFGALDELGVPYRTYATSDASEQLQFDDVLAWIGHGLEDVKQGQETHVDGRFATVLENNQNEGVHCVVVAPPDYINVFA